MEAVSCHAVPMINCCSNALWPYDPSEKIALQTTCCFPGCLDESFCHPTPTQLPAKVPLMLFSVGGHRQHAPPVRQLESDGALVGDKRTGSPPVCSGRHLHAAHWAFPTTSTANCFSWHRQRNCSTPLVLHRWLAEPQAQALGSQATAATAGKYRRETDIVSRRYMHAIH